MNYRGRFVALAVLNAALMLPLSILAADMPVHPAVGTWGLDLMKSKLDPNWPALKSFTYDGKNEYQDRYDQVRHSVCSGN